MLGAYFIINKTACFIDCLILDINACTYNVMFNMNSFCLRDVTNYIMGTFLTKKTYEIEKPIFFTRPKGDKMQNHIKSYKKT